MNQEDDIIRHVNYVILSYLYTFINIRDFMCNMFIIGNRGINNKSMANIAYKLFLDINCFNDNKTNENIDIENLAKVIHNIKWIMNMNFSSNEIKTEFMKNFGSSDESFESIINDIKKVYDILIDCLINGVMYKNKTIYIGYN